MRFKEILESCWQGYRQVGMKKKGDRQVPNCVPVSEQQMEEDLRKWFKEKWVRFGPDGKIRGDCARGSESEGKPKCLPQSKAHALGKKGRASAAAKKRRQDPNPERRGAARNVATKVQETVTDVKAGMAEIYHRLAPKIERYKDSFLAGQLYDELENYAELHGAEREFKQIMATARNSAHMEYDTNPGGFHNWFWFLPFEKQLDEKQDACYRKVKSRYKVWPSAYASGALVQCRKKGAANWGNSKKK